ncbi:MAG: S49 family peptidase [Halodesulfurarchaeum sp.]
MTNPIDKFVKTLAGSYVVVAVVAIVLGAAVAPAVYSTATEEEPYVAVVTLDETIYGGSADAAIEELREVRRNDSIEAVVLKVDSPGGGAAASEAQYMAVKRLAQEKPVVTSVRGMAASGMYYTILPSESIFVTPASLVGNVGVRTSSPIDGGVPDQVTTGPDKLTGGTPAEIRAQIETLKRAFVGSVMQERGDRITLSREEVAHGKIYTGARAVQNGFADQIGDTEAAIKAAASEAGLENYQITRRDPSSAVGIILLSAGSGANATAVQQEVFGYEGVKTTTFLMLYGTPEAQTEVTTDGTR